MPRSTATSPIEPTDASFQEAARFAADGKFDGYVSVGGGSVMDTCKAANLYASQPAEFMTYVNAPIGAGQKVPGPVKPHIACPTTSGTGSETTGIAIFALRSINAKTGIISRRLIPDVALIDPTVTATLPKNAVAATGFDCMSHALESLTARAYPRRLNPAKASTGPCRRERIRFPTCSRPRRSRSSAARSRGRSTMRPTPKRAPR